MSRRSGFVLAQILHDLRAGMLVGPALITVTFGLLGALVVRLERGSSPPAWIPPLDTASAQVVLGTIAGSMMTVVSITYSVLLMALSMASMQFSPRILVGFLRDRASQSTLGLFLGTFLYSLVVLRAVHGDPQAYSAPVAVVVAVALAFVSLTSLVLFISRIAQGIQANHIADRIAHETRAIMDEVLVGAVDEPPVDRLLPPSDCQVVPALRSGYVQLVDYDRLLAVADRHRVTLTIVKAPGEYVVEGTPLATVDGAEVSSKDIDEGFDLGPIRTMQQDVEYGLRQIVDIALKAISPAVNDPSTCVTCIDNLTSLLAYAASRNDPVTTREGLAGGRLRMARSSFRRLVDMCFHQIRQYGHGDLAVGLRLARALTDLAQVTERPSAAPTCCVTRGCWRRVSPTTSSPTSGSSSIGGSASCGAPSNHEPSWGEAVRSARGRASVGVPAEGGRVVVRDVQRPPPARGALGGADAGELRDQRPIALEERDVRGELERRYDRDWRAHRRRLVAGEARLEADAHDERETTRRHDQRGQRDPLDAVEHQEVEQIDGVGAVVAELDPALRGGPGGRAREHLVHDHVAPPRGRRERAVDRVVLVAAHHATDRERLRGQETTHDPARPWREG
ncbi:MAG: DUF2254 domain-containing protein [Myxococcales bacterium]|nr:DUF2254 domain-containing protein [Myxococcales bacterium]